MIRTTTENSASSPYLPQEQSEVPLGKMISLSSAEATSTKSVTNDVPALIQADANSNYQPHQQQHPPPPPPSVVSTINNHPIIHPITSHPIAHPLPPIPPPPQSSHVEVCYLYYSNIQTSYV